MRAAGVAGARRGASECVEWLPAQNSPTVPGRKDGAVNALATYPRFDIGAFTLVATTCRLSNPAGATSHPEVAPATLSSDNARSRSCEEVGLQGPFTPHDDADAKSSFAGLSTVDNPCRGGRACGSVDSRSVPGLFWTLEASRELQDRTSAGPVTAEGEVFLNTYCFLPQKQAPSSVVTPVSAGFGWGVGRTKSVHSAPARLADTRELIGSHIRRAGGV